MVMYTGARDLALLSLLLPKMGKKIGGLCALGAIYMRLYYIFTLLLSSIISLSSAVSASPSPGILPHALSVTYACVT